MENKEKLEETVKERKALDKQDEKLEEEITPLMDFSFDKESSEMYEKKCKLVRQYCNEKIQKYIFFIVLGLVLLFLVPKTGVFGLICFIISIFYFIPIGILNTINWIYRRIHYIDYVSFSYNSSESSFFKFMKKNLQENKK